jgi:integrase
MFWCCYYLRGKQFRESTQETDEKAAAKFLKARLKQVHADEIGARAFVTPKASKLTVAELCAALKADFELRGKLSSQNASHLRRVEKDFDCLAVALTAEKIDKYISERLAEKKGPKGETIPGDRPASINRALQLLGQCYKLAIRRGTLNKSPYIRKLSEADNVRQGFFSEKEIDAVLANLPNDGLRDFVAWCAATGMRRGEAESLTWRMVDADELHIPAVECKNRRARVIPLGPELAAIITRRQTARRVEVNGVARMAEFIFHRGDGERIGDFKKCWRTATRKAGCPGRLLHDLRRSCARLLTAAGVPMQISKLITGHVSDSMFSRYAILDNTQVLAAQKKVAEFRKAI